MGWGDDFLKGVQATAQAAVDSTTQSAQTFIAKSVTTGLVTIGVKPLGNLSAAEIEAGQTGATPTQQKIEQVAKAAAFPVGAVVAVGIGLYFLMGRKK